MARVWKYDSKEEYVDVQIKACNKTLDWQWVKEPSILVIAEQLKSKLDTITKGICHGTRSGNEQLWLSNFLGVEVIGTDISPEAAKNLNTIEWDFHDVKKEWLDSMDFVYSNALDHSYDPKKAVSAWMSCLRNGGYCILHWSPGHLRATKRDPYGATLEEYKMLGGENLEEVIEINPKEFILFIKRAS